MIALGRKASEPCSMEKTVKLSTIRKRRGIFSAGLMMTALLLGSAQAKVVEYDLTIDTLGTTIAGATVDSLAIDGQIPAPTLRATLGDTLRVLGVGCRGIRMPLRGLWLIHFHSSRARRRA